MIERSQVRVPVGAEGEFSLLTFCGADVCFGIRSRSVCQKCRVQVIAKHVCTLPMWFCMK